MRTATAMLIAVLVNSQLPTPNPRGTSVWELAIGSWQFQHVEADLQVGPSAQSTPQKQGGLFPPTDLGLLESPDRALYQKPDLIMDVLKIADGGRVADIGAGAGWFTIRLARRVGPNGVVYAQDIQQPMLDAIKRRVRRERLRNVETVLGFEDNPALPLGALDAILVVDTYQEIDPEDRVDYLRKLSLALKPNGRIGIVNYKPGRGGPGPDPQRRLDSRVVETEAVAAGLRVLDSAMLPFQYLLVVGK